MYFSNTQHPLDIQNRLGRQNAAYVCAQTKTARLKRTGFIAIGLICALLDWSAHAGALDTLSQFMKSTQSGKAHFTQTVTSPPKEGKKGRVKNSEGTFMFLRPQRFRFEYEKPFPQSIVADGHTLWLYDPDIAQVTARSQEKALGSTPASLIASAPDLMSLEKDFKLSEEPNADDLQWVKATPRAQDSQLQVVLIGLSQNAQQAQLSKLEILDAFGQKSVITFDKFEINPSSVTAASFKFTPPQGVETIRP
jgi:outer membrane lipoprotein carrier protein